MLFGVSLFNAGHYFATALQALATCESCTEIISEGVKIQGPWDAWEVIVWRATIRFTSGHVLELLESHDKRMWPNAKHYRKAKYHFMDADRRCVFRVDTHRNSIPFDEPCHLHIGENETRIEDQDPRLKGQSLIAIDFLTIFRWVHQHLEQEPLIWEQS